ncbi:MAG: TatD family hydrolase [Bacteroidales bacterium]|nr:TatD family hydrolase [Bacteroidales bacterium]
MELTDTHTHLYLDEFLPDRDEMIRRAIDRGVTRMLMPNIDRNSIRPMLELSERYPGHCLPMMGLHPTSVGEDYEEVLDVMEDWLSRGGFCGVGETGIDLYWETKYREQQIRSFRAHAELALKFGIPLVIHSRNSFPLILEILRDYRGTGLKGVFHCFGGTREDAETATEMGFMLGIGGVITYRNSRLRESVSHVDPGYLLLETDAPFLSPLPYRGKRNESGYLPLIAASLAKARGVSIEVVAGFTSKNAISLFQLQAS